MLSLFTCTNWLRIMKRIPFLITLTLFAVMMQACDSLEPTPTRPVNLTPSAVVTQGEAVTPTLAPTLTATATVEPTATPISVDAVSQISYLLPLTIQHVTETSATLFFELGTSSDGVVLVNAVDGSAPQQMIALSGSETRQQITIDNLNPGTQYEAVVGLGSHTASLAQPLYNNAAWGAVQFSTQSDAEPLRVAVLGDSGFGDQTTYNLAAQITKQKPDFMINTGDVVYNIDEDPSPYDSYRLKWYLPLEPILKQMPIYPVVGNHDIEPAARIDGIPFYYSAFPPFTGSAFEGRNQWYSIGYGDWQFLMLDTQTLFGEAGRAEQDAFLQERLADTSFKHTIPVFHVPPYTSGSVHPDDGIVVQGWVPLFEAANVPLVLSGHNHNYERLVNGSITYIVSGGGSNTLYEKGEAVLESQTFAMKTHFVLLDLYPDRIELQAIALDGSILDQATIPLQ